MDGIYEIRFRGATDWGMGLLIFKDTMITGVDIAGVQYDGSYSISETHLLADVNMTVPPGVTLVQGTPPQSREYKIPFNAKIDMKAFLAGEPVLINLPPGPVNAIFRKMRAL